MYILILFNSPFALFLILQLHCTSCCEHANVHNVGYLKAFLFLFLSETLEVQAAAVLCTGWECLKGLRESPWETPGMRGSPNCGWRSWGHPEDEVQADLCRILKDHQHTVRPASTKSYRHIQIALTFPVCSVKYNPGNGPFLDVTKSVVNSSS